MLRPGYLARSACASTVMAALAACSGGCRRPSVSSEPPPSSAECLLLRENASGVIGMDVGGSLPLPGGRSLFVFGDTFLGGFSDGGARDIVGAVHSSSAIVDDAASHTCFAGAAFRAGSDGAVAQWLKPTSDQVWPLGPAVITPQGALGLLFTWVRSDPSNGLGFATLGNGIAGGPIDAPVIGVDARALAAPSSEAMPAAWLIHDGFAYLYRCGSQLGPGWFPCIVGRAALTDLASLAAYRYFVAGKGWVGGDGEGTVITEGAPAFSITYNAYLGAFLEIYVEPFARFVSARIASAPEGPFSAKHDVWPCSLPADDTRSYCYAAFEHPQLAAADGQRMFFSYSTNTTDFDAMVRHPNVYWPRLTAVDLAALGP